MSTEQVRERHESEAIQEQNWRGVAESGTDIWVDVQHPLGTSGLIQGTPSVPLRTLSKIDRIERDIKDRFNQGLVAVDMESEDVIVAVRDSHQLAIEMMDIDIDPNQVLIVRVDE